MSAWGRPAMSGGRRELWIKLEMRSGHPPGETTKDQTFTLETVNCLGVCGLGPVVVIDGEYFGSMSSGSRLPGAVKRVSVQSNRRKGGD